MTDSHLQTSNQPDPTFVSPLQPDCPSKAGFRQFWGKLYGSSFGLVLSSAAEKNSGPVLVITGDMAAAQRLEYSLRFYLAEKDISVLQFPDWETLPYDMFSPHQDIISERLTTLSRLPNLKNAYMLVEIKYYKNDRPVIKTITVRQHWKWEEKSEIWYIDTPFPKFR